MPDLMSFFDFAMDIVCFMPSIDEVDAITVSRDDAILISLAAIGLLVLAITVSTLKETFPDNTGVAVIVAVCVVALGFIGLKREMLKGVFLTGYPPMVMALRFAEGAIVGGRTSHVLRWWHSLLFAGVIIGLYYLLTSLPNETLVIAKCGWSLFGAGLAAFMWTRVMAEFRAYQNPFSIIFTFAVFASTLLYVSASPFERMLFQWALPLGLVVGIIGGRMPQGETRRN